jgi:hypothetical protein
LKFVDFTVSVPEIIIGLCCRTLKKERQGAKVSLIPLIQAEQDRK